MKKVTNKSDVGQEEAKEYIILMIKQSRFGYFIFLWLLTFFCQTFYIRLVLQWKTFQNSLHFMYYNWKRKNKIKKILKYIYTYAHIFVCEFKKKLKSSSFPPSQNFCSSSIFFVQVEWLVVKAGLTNFLTTEKQKYCCNMYHERAFN